MEEKEYCYKCDNFYKSVNVIDYPYSYGQCAKHKKTVNMVEICEDYVFTKPLGKIPDLPKVLARHWKDIPDDIYDEADKLKWAMLTSVDANSDDFCLTANVIFYFPKDSKNLFIFPLPSFVTNLLNSVRSESIKMGEENIRKQFKKLFKL